MAITIEPAPKPAPVFSTETQRRLIAVAIKEAGSKLPSRKPSLLARLFRAVFHRSDR